MPLFAIAPLLLAAASGGPRTMVLGIEAEASVEPRIARFLTEELVARVQRLAGDRVMSRADARRVLRLEARRAQLGTADVGELGRLGKALGADELISGTVDKLGRTWLLTVRRFDVRALAIRAERSAKLQRPTSSDLLSAIDRLADGLYGARAAGGATHIRLGGVDIAIDRNAPAVETSSGDVRSQTYSHAQTCVSVNGGPPTCSVPGVATNPAAGRMGGMAGVTALLALAGGIPGMYSTGGDAWAVAAGDFDGDGQPDLAVANQDNDTAGVLLNRGHGRFAAPATFPVGNAPRSLAVGDFDGDGRVDLATANLESRTVSILRNRGNGTFAPQRADPLVSLLSLAVGDFDGDGRLDVAVAGGGLQILFAAGREGPRPTAASSPLGQ